MKSELTEEWIKASIIGTVWAASEIVLGSFLHNLRIPFSGNILTAIGIIILISIGYKWREKGLFWRAGLICAVLKTMSPSAVIFGPMIAIFSEGVLMDASVRLIGRNVAGYMIGAMLAMSWNLFQKIMNYIIFYGNNIIEVYTNLLKYAQNQLHIETDIVWMPILVLLAGYVIFGMVSAVIGIRTGRRITSGDSSASFGGPLSVKRDNRKNPGRDFSYSLGWLALDFLMMVSSFIILGHTSWPVWSITITAIVTIWALRYKRALRQLTKPGLWVFFVVITLLTAFAFTKTKPGENILVAGLITGIQMNFRAVVIIVGFSVLGTELYNPVIRDYFMKTSFKHLPLAFELSAESLPSFIAGIPDFKTIMRNPVSVFSGFFVHAERRLSEIRLMKMRKHTTIIVYGPVEGGKTTFLTEVIKSLRDENIATGGILSERIIEDGETAGYDVVNIATSDRARFMRRGQIDGLEVIGRFSVFPEGLALGKNTLAACLTDKLSAIVIDEVGNMELCDKGWADAVSALIDADRAGLIISVRDRFKDDIITKWAIGNYVTINVTEIKPEHAISIIRNHL